MSQFKEVVKLRVKHFPQIPCKPFIVEVESLQEAKKIMDVLARYDMFQLKNRIKPDFCNAQVLEMFNVESNEWESWQDEETGIDDLDDYFNMLELESSEEHEKR